MLCSSIIFFSNNDQLCEIYDDKYEYLNEPDLLILVKRIANKKGANRAILRTFNHNDHYGVDSKLWSAV